MAHAMTLREARDLYLANAGLSTDTYVEDWVDIKLGPIPLRIPSTDARKRVLPLHDLHHALTGYQADIRGEAEIGAWELGSGLGRHTIGYVLDLMTLAWSPMVAPRRVWRAFVRGRHSRNFYRHPLPLPPDLLDRDVDGVRRSLDLDRPTTQADARDGLAFLGWFGLALLVGALSLALLPFMVAWGVWGRWQSRHQARPAQA